MTMTWVLIYIGVAVASSLLIRTVDRWGNPHE